jgi:hypothetical protein
VAEGRAVLAEDTEVIVLGCAGLADLVQPLKAAALGIPVVEGVAVAVTMADGLLTQGLSTSRAKTYAPRRPVGAAMSFVLTDVLVWQPAKSGPPVRSTSGLRATGSPRSPGRKRSRARACSRGTLTTSSSQGW